MVLVPLSEAKTYLRVDSSDEDMYTDEELEHMFEDLTCLRWGWSTICSMRCTGMKKTLITLQRRLTGSEQKNRARYYPDGGNITDYALWLF
ncbi:MAG: hypothetical protein LIP11_17655, partial [Clostridiales bacterium]|nr:hypothetical protein [Clostridiales bacterium]